MPNPLHNDRDQRPEAAYKPPEYDHGEGRMPEDVRTAECHTFATGESYPDICMAPDCPAREYL
jgi:hypothetical protein